MVFLDNRDLKQLNKSDNAEVEMAEDTNYFLSDEFVAFSAKIARIHESKKSLKAELKSFYEKTKEQEKSLDDEAKAAEKEFSDWKKTVKSNTEE